MRLSPLRDLDEKGCTCSIIERGTRRSTKVQWTKVQLRWRFQSVFIQVSLLEYFQPRTDIYQTQRQMIKLTNSAITVDNGQKSRVALMTLHLFV